MELEPIAGFLEEKGLGVQGVSIFAGEMPAACDFGVLLMDRYSGSPIDPYLPKYRVTGFRIATRSTDYASCRTLARQVSKALTLYGETRIGNLHVKMLMPQNDPKPYRRSAGGYWEAEVDFDINFVIDDPDLLV